MHKILPLQMDVSWTVCPWLKRRVFFRSYRSSEYLSSRRHGGAGRFSGVRGSERILSIRQPNDHVINWPASSICLLFVMSIASTN